MAGRVFAYARVSTMGQTVENQLGEISAAGFEVEPRRIVTETISGSIGAMERPGFAKLVDRLESGDVLVVTKLDRLGRNSIDVSSTVQRLAEIGVRVHCLALAGLDLTSAAGAMTMNVLNAVAQFERDLMLERTHAGLARARAAGKKLGRRPSLSDRQKRAALADLAGGMSISAAAKKYEVSRLTISRLKNPSSETDRQAIGE